MKKHICAICFTALAIMGHCVFVQSDPPAGPAARSWQNLATNDFNGFLKKVTSEEQLDWISTRDQPSSIKANTNVQNQTAFLERYVLHQLLSYPVSLPGLTRGDAKGIADNVSLLQDFRDLLMKNPTYSNLLIADTVNRVIFVCIARHITSARSISPDVKEQVQRLHRFDLDPTKLASALDRETIQPSGTDTSSPEVVELPAFAGSASQNQTAVGQANERKLREFYRVLMQASGTKSLDAALTRPMVSGRLALLENRDFPALLMLMWATENSIHVTLPLLTAYIEKRPDFCPEDGYTEIKTALNLSKEERQQYGSYLAAATPGAEGEVRRLLDQVRGGTLDSFAGLAEIKRETAFKPSEEALVEKALSDIEGAKAQIKMLRSLSSEATVSLEDIRAYLGKDIFMPQGGGKYQVGEIGKPASFICPDGKVISIRR